MNPHLDGRFYLHTIEGLEHMAAQEVTEATRVVAGVLRPGHVRVMGNPSPQALVSLRLTEDVFCCLLELSHMDRSRTQLGRLYKALRKAPLEWALLTWCEAMGRRLPARLTYRVVARKSGQHNYTRRELGNAVEAAIHHRT